jgi:hypothetical protein
MASTPKGQKYESQRIHLVAVEKKKSEMLTLVAHGLPESPDGSV